jgi:SAM-dependent methyltransferase
MQHQYIKGVSRNRKDSNTWIQRHAKNIKGKVLSLGSGDDYDGAGNRYREYFKSADSYTTSEFESPWETDMRLDARDMKEVEDGAYDCLFVSGVLEHIDDMPKAVKEMKRILRKGGTMLVGLPFRQAIHSQDDYWRFTEYSIYYLFGDMKIKSIYEIGMEVDKFPAAYWVKAVK